MKNGLAYKYVDETVDIARHYSVNLGRSQSWPWASARRQSEVSIDQQALTEPSILNYTVGSNNPDPFLPPHRPDGPLAGYSPYQLQLSPQNPSRVSSASPHFSRSSHASLGSDDLFNSIETSLPIRNEHEACLMQYFVVHLAPWVQYSFFFFFTPKKFH
jgi:hypothetical protein